MERFLASIEPGEALVLRARCHPREAVPFAALDEAIDELALHLLSRPPERNVALVQRDVDALLAVFPVLGRVGLPEPAVRRSNLLNHLLLRGDALEMRARVAIAHAADPQDRRAALRIAGRAARARAQLGRPDALARATLLEAGTAARRGDRRRAETLAVEAATRFAAADMPLHDAQARLCAAGRHGSEAAGRAAREEARAALTARRVAHPERWIRVVAPGFEGEGATRARA